MLNLTMDMARNKAFQLTTFQASLLVLEFAPSASLLCVFCLSVCPEGFSARKTSSGGQKSQTHSNHCNIGYSAEIHHDFPSALSPPPLGYFLMPGHFDICSDFRHTETTRVLNDAIQLGDGVRSRLGRFGRFRRFHRFAGVLNQISRASKV